MGRNIASIVVIGVLGLLALMAMAVYGTSKNPRVRVKLAIERAAPVRVEACKIADSQGGARRDLVLTLKSRDGGPVSREALLAAAFAAAVPPQAGDEDTVLPDFGWLTIEVDPRPDGLEEGAPGAPTYTALVCDRFNLTRWRDLEPRVPDIVARLAPDLGAGTTAEIVAEPGMLELIVRPARGDVPTATAARKVAAVTRAFPRIAIAKPGGKPAVVSLDEAAR